jgi:hypothetical protein
VAATGGESNPGRLLHNVTKQRCGGRGGMVQLHVLVTVAVTDWRIRSDLAKGTHQEINNHPPCLVSSNNNNNNNNNNKCSVTVA